MAKSNKSTTTVIDRKLKAKGEQTMNEVLVNTEAKGETVMSTQTTEKRTKTVWDYTREAIAEGFIQSGLSKDFEVKVKRYFDKEFTNFETGEKKIFQGANHVFNYLTYLNGLDKIDFNEIKYVEETVDEKTNKIIPAYYIVKVKNFNPSVKTKSKKTGNMYHVFFRELGMLCQKYDKATA